MVNLSADEPVTLDVDLMAGQVLRTSGRYISGAVTAHNTFEQPDAVTPDRAGHLESTRRTGFRDTSGMRHRIREGDAGVRTGASAAVDSTQASDDDTHRLRR